MLGHFAALDVAAAHFAARLAFETDPTDVDAALASEFDFVLVDSRGIAAWQQGRIPGAMHLPTSEIAARAPLEIRAGTPVVTYCWGPGCNGSTRAALEFARHGYPVKEMIGGFEYWAREGLGIENADGHIHRDRDPLTAPLSSINCDC